MNPHRDWSVQVSYGFLSAPESLEPFVDLHRWTASSTYQRLFGHKSYWATTFVWGRNIKNERGYAGFTTDAYLLESSYSFAERRSVFTRFERVDKDQLFSGAHVHGSYSDIYTVQRFTIGGMQSLPAPRTVHLGLGASLSLSRIPPGTEFVFGDRLYSATVFLRLRSLPVFRSTGNTKVLRQSN
jgi:hypothetical protein